MDVEQAREARKYKNKNALKCVRNVYAEAENKGLSSPASRALGIPPRGGISRLGESFASVDPSREANKTGQGTGRQGGNPFENLRTEEDESDN